MSIFFNTPAIRELLEHIDTAVTRLNTIGRQLQTTTHTAHDLLAATGTASHHHSWDAALATVTAGLTTEHFELATRIDTLITADARTAYQLATNTGRIVSSIGAARALESGWTYDETFLRHEQALLDARPRPLTKTETLRHNQLTATLTRIETPFTATGHTGDPDADLATPRIGTPLHITATNPTQRGRDYLDRALADTANPDQILADEFEAYLHENGNVTIVLPGVIDLSNPNWGYDDRHHSLRDLDQVAATSFLNPGLANNAYAQRVSDWAQLMVDNDVITPGATTAIVGHSLGSDTAFDLALDEHFNGELLTVTHVFGAGYELADRLNHMPAHTTAVAATNIYDAVSLAEGTIRHGPTISTGRLRVEALEKAVNATTGIANNRIEQLEAGLKDSGIAEVDLGTIPEVNLAGNMFRPVEPNGLHVTFEGGFDLDGVGHHQDYYREFLADANNTHLNAYLDDLDKAGFTAGAVAVSIDISRPTSTDNQDSSPKPKPQE